MLYFTGEGFRHLANQNQGHIRVMLECRNNPFVLMVLHGI